LANALTKALRLGDEIRGCDDNLDLDRPVVDEKSVQLGEGLAGSIGVVECDMGDAAADTARAIRQLDPLNLSD